jgi:hypothetical protein
VALRPRRSYRQRRLEAYPDDDGPKAALSDFCFWHKADMAGLPDDVRFPGRSGPPSREPMSRNDPQLINATGVATAKYSRHLIAADNLALDGW